MKFEKTEVWGFKQALRGMRNPMESWKKSDSGDCCYQMCKTCFDKNKCKNYCYDVDDREAVDCPLHKYDFAIGDNDMKLAQTLVRAGSEHRKFMRQIFISVDITAPLYWWKEFDTYKIGTAANSTSTMHKLATTPITLSCFETDDINFIITDECGTRWDMSLLSNYIPFLEELRFRYIETKNKCYWKELIRWLPESWLQKRTVTMTYENLFAMCSKGQRRFHKLNEWSGNDNSNVVNFISWARTLPYAQELIFIDEVGEQTK